MLGCDDCMIDNWLFVLGIIVVLMIPGAGNALVAGAAHQYGSRKTSLLIPAILLGYLYAINAWALAIHLLLPIWPNFKILLHLASSIYVGWLTFKLFQKQNLEKHHIRHQSLNPWKMFEGTLKNPKAALFAAGILPDQTWSSPFDFFVIFSIFTLVLIPVAVFWMSFGQAILSGKSNKIKTDLLYKGSVLFLLLCAIPLILQLWS